MSDFILVIDQSTTSTSCFAYAPDGTMIDACSHEFKQYFPADGWVEHDAEEIWQTVVTTARTLLAKPTLAGQHCIGIGITNQRETVAVWDRATGKPIHHAIVWQDRRTASHCAALREKGLEKTIQEKTGLLLDPYFSATKVAWILDHVDGAREKAERGALACGTMESWLIWNLTGGVHATDETNASRTSLCDIRKGTWDDELLDIFQVPAALLPEIRPNQCLFGTSLEETIGVAAPIYAAIGDQQAASFGNHCFSAGQMKATYGTGCFVLMHTGEEMILSQNRLLSTIACRLGDRRSYALEGSIFMAGAIVQWMRDQMGLFTKASETEALARAASPTSDVIMVPAFTGLGAPYWDPNARGALLGMTRDTQTADIVRAGLESVSFQTHDLITAFRADLPKAEFHLRVDGGMVENNWFAQNLSDITGLTLARNQDAQATARGAFYLALLGTGHCADIAGLEKLNSADDRIAPTMAEADRQRKIAGWNQSVSHVRGLAADRETSLT